MAGNLSRTSLIWKGTEMSKCIRCDICGAVYESELNGLAIMESDRGSGILKSWRNRENVNLKERIRCNVAIVMDVCDDCKEQIVHEVERQMEMKKPNLTEAVE